MKIQDRLSLNPMEWIALALVTIGAINWGLVGLAGFIGGNLNLVNLILGGFPVLESVVYLLVGLAGLYVIYFGYELYDARTEKMERAEPEPTVR